MFNDFASGDVDNFWHEPDFLLADIISGFVNRGGMELGITLFIGGLVVTGALVSESEYLQSISKMFTNQAKKSLVNPSKKDLKTTEEVFDFTGLAEDVDLASPDENDPDDFDDLDDELEPEIDGRRFPVIRHLHLKDPMIVQPQPGISFSHGQVPIVRVRLTAIHGWIIGKINIEEDDMLDTFPPPPPPSEIRH